MPKVYVAIGANLDFPLKTVKQVIKELKQAFPNDFTSSFLYQTKPIGGKIQPDYINGAVCFNTSLSLHELFNYLKTLEIKWGKKPKAKTDPRPIDLDLIFYGEKSYQDEELIIPHISWKKRLFVLKPLLDIAEEITIEENKRVEIWKFSDLIKEFPLVEQQQIKLIYANSSR